jgi:hypothetical protein
MNGQPFNLDLDEYLDGDETCLVGREKGEAILARLQAAGIDWAAMEADGPIIVTIPTRIVTMNFSFFEPMWGKRVKTLGPHGFLVVYKFVASHFAKGKIFDHISGMSFRGIIQGYNDKDHT